jgi:hypothetical protein
MNPLLLQNFVELIAQKTGLQTSEKNAANNRRIVEGSTTREHNFTPGQGNCGGVIEASH